MGCVAGLDGCESECLDMRGSPRWGGSINVLFYGLRGGGQFGQGRVNCILRELATCGSIRRVHGGFTYRLTWVLYLWSPHKGRGSGF